MELAAECSYPVAEGITSGVLVLSVYVINFVFFVAFMFPQAKPAVDELVASLLDRCVYSTCGAIHGEVQTAGCGRVQKDLMTHIGNFFSRTFMER